MTPEDYEAAKRLYDTGRHSALSIARCLTGVHFREVEAAFDFAPHADDDRPEQFKQFLLSQPWVWRPDNQDPTEAPWERIAREYH